MQQIQTPTGTALINNLSPYDTMMVVECASIDDYLSRFSDIIEEQGPIRRANMDYMVVPLFWKHWFKKPEDRFDIKALIFYSFVIDNLEIISIDDSIEDSYDETKHIAKLVFLTTFYSLKKQKAKKRSFTLTDGNDKVTAHVIDTARTKPSNVDIAGCNIGDLVKVGISKPDDGYIRHPTCQLYTMEKSARKLN